MFSPSESFDYFQKWAHVILISWNFPIWIHNFRSVHSTPTTLLKQITNRNESFIKLHISNHPSILITLYDSRDRYSLTNHTCQSCFFPRVAFYTVWNASLGFPILLGEFKSNNTCLQTLSFIKWHLIYLYMPSAVTFNRNEFYTRASATCGLFLWHFA